MKTSTSIFIISFVIFSAFLISACSDQQPQLQKEVGTVSETKRGTSVGDTAPEFELRSIEDSAISFESLKGKPSVLVFWSAYCTVCKEEAPKINSLHEQFGSNVNVVGINVGESMARTQEGIKDFDIKYAVARDEGTVVTKLYKVIGTPTVIFLDMNGTVRYNGNELPADYRERLNALNTLN